MRLHPLFRSRQPAFTGRTSSRRGYVALAHPGPPRAANSNPSAPSTTRTEPPTTKKRRRDARSGRSLHVHALLITMTITATITTNTTTTTIIHTRNTRFTSEKSAYGRQGSASPDQDLAKDRTNTIVSERTTSGDSDDDA